MGQKLLVATLVAAIAVLFWFASRSTHAADAVCGDGAKETPEQCDDGNLKNGDGCSNTCTVEACGNGIRDINEQCDDGGTASGDGCNNYCQIEFCGDSTVQSGLGEQCDDGNGIAGDGCNKSCQSESAPPKDPNENPVDTPTDPKNPTDPNENPNPLPADVPVQATQSLNFILSGGAAEYIEALTSQDNIRLTLILQKLSNGRRLNAQEREWAATILQKLSAAKAEERTRYTDLLRQFISTPISSDVVEEKDLDKARLVDVEVPVAIEELDRAVDIVRRGEIGKQVGFDVTRLNRQGLEGLKAEFPEGYQDAFRTGARPIEVFATLKSMKETTEKYATTSVPASLEIIRAEARSLRQALPVLQREYGVNAGDVEPLLTSIEALTEEATKQDTERVVNAINRFISTLERRGVLSPDEFAQLDERKIEAAERVRRLMEDAGRGGNVTVDDVAAVADGLSAAAPADKKAVFERDDLTGQREAILNLLEGDGRIHELRQMLREDGRTDFDARYDLLRRDIARIGDSDHADTACDDSMPAALACTNAYLTDLQNAVRGRSTFSRFIGTLQDFFGIGS